MKAAPVFLSTILLAIITSRAFADVPPPPPPPRAPQLRPDPSPVAQAHVDLAQMAVKQALAALARATTVNHGGYVEKAMVEVNKAADDLTLATAYIKAHPDANTLANGPASADAVHLTVAPDADRYNQRGSGGVAQTNMLTALDSLNAALNEFLNPAGSSYKGPVMGDLGGLRKTIMDDIVLANTDVLGGISFANGTGPAAPPAPKATADDSDNSQRLPSAIAGLALSAALSLGGLHVFSRKKLANN